MAKDMYDERGILRPECTMTESQRQSQISINERTERKTSDTHFQNNNKNILSGSTEKIKKMLNQELEKMQENIMKNKITFQEFEDYYHFFKTALASSLVDKPLIHTLTLSDAVVVMPVDKEEVFSEYKKDLEEIIANEIRKHLPAKGLLLEDELNLFQKIKSQYIITFQQYTDYCEKLSLAVMAKLENVDLLECAKKLLSIKIETKKYDEHLKLHILRLQLIRIIASLEEPKKSNQRRQK